MGNRGSIPNIEQLGAEAQHLFEATNAESPLGCALIVGASIERAVLALVGKYFVDGDTAKGMLGENGVLGTFASSSKIAYCLGLISKGMFQNINRIGHIRNIFAHSNIPVDFDNPGVVEVCNRLTFPRVSLHIVVGKGSPTPLNELHKTPRDRFTAVGIYTYSELLVKALLTEHRERCIDGWDS